MAMKGRKQSHNFSQSANNVNASIDDTVGVEPKAWLLHSHWPSESKEHFVLLLSYRCCVVENRCCIIENRILSLSMHLLKYRTCSTHV